MPHQRKLIRDAVVAALTGTTAAGAQVTSTRVEPIRKTALPALSVYTLSEQVHPESDKTSPRELTRELKLEVAGFVADTAALPIADAMDALALQVETVMEADPYFGDLASTSILESTEMTLPEPTADPLIGVVTLTFAVTYRGVVGTTTPTDEFQRTGVTTKIAGAGDDNVVTDLINQQVTP